ncbi:MAG: nucleotidyltransferase family protein [Bacillota bacterium]|nr:nucleotidyltransferase family protein [Bacillota bacterium]
MLVDTVIKERREKILELGLNHGARKIRIFGSVARGEEMPKSDIDLLIDFDEDRSLFDLIAFKHDLEELLGRKVDVVTEDSVHWYIKDKIIKEAVEI